MAKRDDPAARAAFDRARADLLGTLRSERLVYVLIDVTGEADGGRRRLLAAKDDAHPEYERAREALNRALAAWDRELSIARLETAQVEVSALTPLRIDAIELAPKAQSARARLAGIIPLLLVLLAVSGAFYPALDLIAGERERGTLETLLSWPVKRRDLFLGKLHVTIAAAALTVILNLSSLAVTAAVIGGQLPQGPAGDNELSGLFAAGFGILALCFLALLPVIVTLAAVSLALAGIAASVKEAQTYLTPLFLVVVVAASVALVPGARPNLALDLIPITGPVLALKEALRSADVPWLHIGVSTLSSVALAAVVVGWSVRLLDSEAFCYPGLVRAGWGRWRTWGRQPPTPGALEAMGLFALCVGLFTAGSGLFAGYGPVAQVVGPLIACILLPALVHSWLGHYPIQTTLGLARADRGSLIRALLCVPFALMAAVALGSMQPKEPSGEAAGHIERIVQELMAIGGLPLVVACMALAPGICEELLCRGPLLAGLRHSLGRWGGILVSAFLFAALHMSPYRFLPQLMLGIVLGVLTIRANSILPAVLLHTCFNGTALVVSVLAAGQGEAAIEEPNVPILHALGLLAAGLAGLAVCSGGISRWHAPKRHDLSHAPLPSTDPD
ncbi:MAG: CPBP family intramembrane metalloprotease [Planctomycetes bacterium]|nr:CPBP family intramembrane metalloprotease [Planctomycetota bacterium]